MSVTLNELDAFYQFASQRLGAGESLTQLEDVLDAFRSQKSSLEATSESQSRQGIADDSFAAWSSQLRRWADSFPKLANAIDDSREGIYRDDP